jgi:hypothetical protein
MGLATLLTLPKPTAYSRSTRSIVSIDQLGPCLDFFSPTTNCHCAYHTQQCQYESFKIQLQNPNSRSTTSGPTIPHPLSTKSLFLNDAQSLSRLLYQIFAFLQVDLRAPILCCSSSRWCLYTAITASSTLYIFNECTCPASAVSLVYTSGLHIG